MEVFKVVELLNKYGGCPKCGNEMLGNGQGSLEVTDDKFIRKCKCGFEVVINDKKPLSLKDKLDKRICDCEENAKNTQTFREFIRDTEEEFCMEHVNLDNCTNEALNEYLDFLSELWGK